MSCKDPGPQRPLVHIVILSWNRRRMLLECLATLRTIQYPRYAIVVVDNASQDDSVAQVRLHHPEVHVLLNPRNLGYTGGANRGIRHALAAGAEFVWLLNDDASVGPITLSEMVDEAERDPNIGALSPVSYYRNERDKLQFAGDYVDVSAARVRSSSKPAEANQPRELETLVLYGAAMLLRSEALRRAGLLDERLFAYWEDYDISMRIVAAGMKTHVVQTVIFHNVTLPAVEGRSRPPYFYYFMIRNEFWFWRSHLPGFTRWVRKALGCMGDAIGEAAMCRHHGHPDCADACLDGIWNALLPRPGAFEDRRRMPSPLRVLLSWRPFFWRAMLCGDWSTILRRPARRA